MAYIKHLEVGAYTYTYYIYVILILYGWGSFDGIKTYRKLDLTSKLGWMIQFLYFAYQNQESVFYGWSFYDGIKL